MPQNMQEYLEELWDGDFTGFHDILVAYRECREANGLIVRLGQRELLIEFTTIYLHLIKNPINTNLEQLTTLFQAQLEAAFYPN